MFKDYFNSKVAWLAYNLGKLTQLGLMQLQKRRKLDCFSIHENIKEIKFSPFVQVLTIIIESSGS